MWKINSQFPIVNSVNRTELPVYDLAKGLNQDKKT